MRSTCPSQLNSTVFPHAVRFGRRISFPAEVFRTIDRRIHRALNRGREGNFAPDGRLGFDLHGRTVGEDRSNAVILDDVLARLLTFPNVLVTGRQAFFTREALGDVADAMAATFTGFERGRDLPNAVEPPAKAN